MNFEECRGWNFKRVKNIIYLIFADLLFLLLQNQNMGDAIIERFLAEQKYKCDLLLEGEPQIEIFFVILNVLRYTKARYLYKSCLYLWRCTIAFKYVFT